METEFRLRVLSAGGGEVDLRTVRAVATALRDAGLPVRPYAPRPAPGAKGGGVVGALLLRAGEAAIGKAIEVVAAVFTRPAAPPVPVEIEVEVAGGKARVKFDPRTLTPEQIPALVRAVARGAAAPA